jgi:hypothetical protein
MGEPGGAKFVSERGGEVHQVGRFRPTGQMNDVHRRLAERYKQMASDLERREIHSILSGNRSTPPPVPHFEDSTAYSGRRLCRLFIPEAVEGLLQTLDETRLLLTPSHMAPLFVPVSNFDGGG